MRPGNARLAIYLDRLRPYPHCAADREVEHGNRGSGLIERVTFNNKENGFCGLRVKACRQRDLITALGHARLYRGWRVCAGERNLGE